MATADIVNTWFRERLACGALARDTDAYNQVSAALPALIATLDAPAPAQPAVGPAAAAVAAEIVTPAPPVDTSAFTDDAVATKAAAKGASAA